MSSGGSSNVPTTKLQPTNTNDIDPTAAAAAAAAQKPPTNTNLLEEDDEFEDFPVEDWTAADAEASASGDGTSHLWEESWDDDDEAEEFSKQLKEELKKVEGGKS